MVFTGKFVYIYIYSIYVCVLTIKALADVSGLPSFASIRDRDTIIYDTRKTLYLNEPPAKLLKKYLKNNSNIYFIVI